MTSQTPEVKEIEEVIEDFVKGMWYVTGESQYPEGAEKKSYHQGFSDAVAMAYIELTGTPKSKGLINKLLLSQQQKHREELQKARQDWLRSEIEKYKIVKYIPEWEKSLNITERFAWANENQQKHILGEIKYQREQGGYEALQTIIDYYQAELNQDNK